MLRSFLVVLAVALANPAMAAPDRGLGLSLGLGVSAPMEIDGRQEEGTGVGGFASAEYIYRLTEWFTPRIYTGLLLTSPNGHCAAGVFPCDISTKIAFTGAKFRLMVPIPYVGPFIELGLGASAGRITTRIGDTRNSSFHGVTYHVPFSLGLALGGDRQFDIALQYLAHPDQKQFGGALALGLVLDLG